MRIKSVLVSYILEFIAIADLVQTTTRPIISTGIDKANDGEARFLEKKFSAALVLFIHRC